MKTFPCILLTLTACSCAVLKPAVPSETVRTEVRTETVIATDTVFVHLPQIIERVAVPDTASVLENAYAMSEASVSSGILSHSLEVKPGPHPVAVENRTVYRDSLVSIDRVVTKTVEVEKPFSRWQRLRLDVGTASLILIVIAMLYLLFKLFHNLNPKVL